MAEFVSAFGFAVSVVSAGAPPMTTSTGSEANSGTDECESTPSMLNAYVPAGRLAGGLTVSVALAGLPGVAFSDTQAGAPAASARLTVWPLSASSAVKFTLWETPAVNGIGVLDRPWMTGGTLVLVTVSRTSRSE